ncbi:MAG: hypothetical protein AMK75_06935 [Planctomycetes bacterium SM23_65]|nr:MAG: hypothetical protein AMK75_06935 [Planctomycetes bacterium SM23_65]
MVLFSAGGDLRDGVRYTTAGLVAPQKHLVCGLKPGRYRITPGGMELDVQPGEHALEFTVNVAGPVSLAHIPR